VPFGIDYIVPGNNGVARYVKVQLSVAAGIEETASRAPTCMVHTCLGPDFTKRPVTVIAIEEIRPIVSHVKIEVAVVVVVAHADSVAPSRGVNARFARYILKLPVAQIAIQPVTVWYQLPCRCQLKRIHDVDV